MERTKSCISPLNKPFLSVQRKGSLLNLIKGQVANLRKSSIVRHPSQLKGFRLDCSVNTISSYSFSTTNLRLQEPVYATYFADRRTTEV
jgi:hypothetical protein